MNLKTVWLALGVFLVLLGCGVDKPVEVTQAEKSLPDNVDFNLHVKPILSDKCYFCHGPDLANQKAGLRLDTPEGAFAALEESGNTAIVPGKAHRSELVHRILSEDKEEQMPPPESNVNLTAHEKAVLIRWIEEGAEYKKHWAFIPPESLEIPEVAHQGRIVNEIDNFIFRTLERNHLEPQAEADKETLIRRATFDLTGLPPSLEEIDAFLADTSEDAYEKVVDRLLTSPHYGEKMATDWMDASRYADTHGYSVDRYRPMWPWRDWVIKSFNENKPFNQFVTWQLAGDLMPEPTKEQILATAFNRNHAQNMEGGIVNEEYRIEYVADRTNTLGKSLMAMTLECSRCHDHKFDPISQKEYFQMFGFFNNVDEAGQISWDNATPVPTLLLTDEKQDSIIQFLDEKIAQKEDEISAIATGQSESVEFNQKVNIKRYLNDGLVAHFGFEKTVSNQFVNVANPRQKAKIVLAQPRKNPEALEPTIEQGKFGKALLSNGDDPLSLGSIGAFDRAQPFTIGLWMKVPTALENGTIFHKGQGKILYNFRGYYLSIKDNKLEALMAHTWPYNNISVLSATEIPKDEWFHLALTYDGSSQAQGLKVYLNGEAVEMKVEKDNLYKDILLSSLAEEPGLSFGALWRGTGTKNTLIDEIKVYDRELFPAEITAWTGSEELDDQAKHTLATIHTTPGYWQKKQELQQLRTQQNALVESVPEIMVMDEMVEPRTTHLLERGAYDAPGEEVTAGTPESILPFPDSLPRNRLGLAKWLFSEDNPLTARVMVNRYWQSYFGRGIVSSAADFGNQGELPTHPKLLDWLAVRFVESGWDIKAMQKMIVMSATYRQSSKTPKELLEKDYDNKLLSRGPSARLTAEMLRDNALHASGLLVDKIGGESVKPYQPEGLWKISGARYVPDTGEKLYRRSLYTLWKRTVPPPSMNTFDAPTRSYCEVTRQKTSTPLQSLVLLNDPQFVEASRALAAKIVTTEEAHKARLTKIYRSLTAKHPSDKELQVLDTFYNKQRADFQKVPEKIEGWLETGEFVVEPSINKQELAAYAVVASTVMNADATVMKR